MSENSTEVKTAKAAALNALKRIIPMLDALDPEERERVMTWLRTAYPAPTGP